MQNLALLGIIYAKVDCLTSSVTNERSLITGVFNDEI